MTKYILHGGRTRNKTHDNEEFFLEMVKDIPLNATILSVYFARDKELWSKLSEQDKINFSHASPQNSFNFIQADDDLHIFVEQIKKADLIYLWGGHTKMLMSVLSKVKYLKELFKDKVVAGSSAGVNVLSKFYYSTRSEGIFDGLGILPIKAICHYKMEYLDKLEELKEYGEELEVYAIPEEKFFVIED